MAKLIHIEHDEVTAACSTFEKLLAKEPVYQQVMKERQQWEKAEKARRDKEFAATRSKDQSRSGDK